LIIILKTNNGLNYY